MTDSEPLTEDAGFWGLILGKKYDNIADDDRTLRQLVSQFYVGRTKRADTQFTTTEELVEELAGATKNEAKQILLSIWAEEKWQEKSSGSNGFKLESSLEDELGRLEEEGLFVEVLANDLTLVWPSKEVRMPTREDDAIRSQLFERAHPLFVRSNGGDEIEVRGAKNRIREFSETFTDSDGVNRIERSQTTKTVIDGLSAIFREEIGSLTLTEIEFRQTYLPDGSSLALHNPEGVRKDLNSEAIYDHLIDLQSLSELSELGFTHNKTGKNVDLKVKREDTGFFFEIQDSYIPDSEKEAIKLLIEEKLGISFDSIYPYDVQLQDSYIFHQILTGNVDAYNRYYEDLPRDERELLDDFLEIDEIGTYECYRCHGNYVGEKPDECEKCGSESFREDRRREVNVDDNAVHEGALEALQKVDETLSGDGREFLNLDIQGYETEHNQFIKVTFHEMASAGKEANTHRYEYINYCLGNGRLPRRIDRYLLNSVLVVYGKAYLNGREKFGTIDLHDLLLGDPPEELLVQALQKSKSLFRKRVIDRANDAYGELQDLMQRQDAGQFEDLSSEERSALKEEYDYKEFERDVFYLLKLMFVFTERWGREGEVETDGCLVIPQHEKYFIVSYDPKLTYSAKGYDLDSGEKNKAAWYISTESLGGALAVSLSDEQKLNSHLLISNNFREGQYPHVSSRVQEWLAESDSSHGAGTPVSFMPLDALVKIYDIFTRHYDQIVEYPSVNKAFKDAFIEQIRDSDDGYSVIDDAACESIEEQVLQARKGTSRDRQLKDHAE